MSGDHLEQTSAFLDGELDPARTAAAERHIETCAECQALVAAASEVSELLRGPAARLKAPKGLGDRISQALSHEAAHKVVPMPTRAAPRRAYWLGAASGVGLSAVAAALVLTIGPMMSAQNMTLALADDHVAALMQGRTIAVVSSNHHTVKPWFAGRAPVSPTVVDFADQGFRLTGGRVATVAGRKAAVVVYRHGAHEIDLYAWSRDAGSPPTRSERRGYHVVSWAEGDLAYAAVSDVQPDELDRFARLVRGVRE